jgi:predicted aconitase with swiveling domain
MREQELGSAFFQVVGRTYVDRPMCAISACVQAENERDVLFIKEVLGGFFPGPLIDKTCSASSSSMCGLVICLPESRGAVTGLWHFCLWLIKAT